MRPQKKLKSFKISAKVRKRWWRREVIRRQEKSIYTKIFLFTSLATTPLSIYLRRESFVDDPWKIILCAKFFHRHSFFITLKNVFLFHFDRLTWVSPLRMNDLWICSAKAESRDGWSARIKIYNVNAKIMQNVRVSISRHDFFLIFEFYFLIFCFWCQMPPCRNDLSARLRRELRLLRSELIFLYGMRAIIPR